MFAVQFFPKLEHLVEVVFGQHHVVELLEGLTFCYFGPSFDVILLRKEVFEAIVFHFCPRSNNITGGDLDFKRFNIVP